MLRLYPPVTLPLPSIPSWRKAGHPLRPAIPRHEPAAEQALRLAHQGQQVLLTCAESGQEAALRRAVAGQAGIDVVHFHRLCFDLASRARLLPISAQDAEQFYRELLPQALTDAAHLLPVRYDAIVVAQAALFESGWWDGLRALLKEGAAPVLLCGISAELPPPAFAPPSAPA